MLTGQMAGLIEYTRSLPLIALSLPPSPSALRLSLPFLPPPSPPPSSLPLSHPPPQTSFPTFLAPSMEVYRSQGDFQWLYSALQEACPERIVPPLRPPISLDATISEFQRFLSRVSTHKVLSTHNLFVVFLSGSAEVSSFFAESSLVMYFCVCRNYGD